MNTATVITLCNLVITLESTCALAAKPILFCTVGENRCPEDQYCESGFGYCTPCSFLCEGVGSNVGACRQACYWRFPDLANATETNSTDGIDSSVNHTGSVGSIEDLHNNQQKQLDSDTEQDNTGFWVLIIAVVVCIAFVFVLGLIVLFKWRDISDRIKSKNNKGQKHQKAPNMTEGESMLKNDKNDKC